MKISNCSLDCVGGNADLYLPCDQKFFFAFRINPELKQRIEEIVGEEQRRVSQACELLKRGSPKTIEGKSRNLSAACWPGKRENEVSDAGRSFCDSRAHCSIMIEVFTRSGSCVSFGATCHEQVYRKSRSSH